MTKQRKQIIAFIAECVGWIAIIVIMAFYSIWSAIIFVIVAVLIFIAPNLNCGKSKNAPKKREKQDSQDKQKDDEYDEWKEYEKSKQKLLEKYAKLAKENKNEK